VVDGKDHVYNDGPSASKTINICQLERNPDLETTTRTRLNPKHVDERTRIVQETASKISQAVRCWWHFHRWGWVGPDTGEGFRRVSRGKVSTMAIMILLDLLYQPNRSDRYVEKKGYYTPEQKVVLGREQVRRLRNPDACARRELAEPADTIMLSQSKGKLNMTSMIIAYRWWGRVVVCRIVIGCADVWWILQSTVHSDWLRDALPMNALLVITSHMRVLKYDIHG
jgi:hypothetical protein